jgi:hypothetical protein
VASRPLLARDASSFAGTSWSGQHYCRPGSPVQWLGTSGRANALFTGGRRYDERLRALLAEVLPLAPTARAAAPGSTSSASAAGGRPWVSGLAQGTAVQALSRAAIRLGEPALLGAARAALGVFRTRPAAGRTRGHARGRPLPDLLLRAADAVLNGFVQALNGLLDFAATPTTRTGLAPLRRRRGAARGRAELVRHRRLVAVLAGHEADLGYHRLPGTSCARCARGSGRPTRRGPPATARRPERFERYLHEPPRLTLRLAAGRPRARRVLLVRIGLSKVSTVAAVARRKGRVVWTRTERRPRGLHAFGLRPAGAGPLHVSVRAVDLAGNAASVGGASTSARRGARGRRT